MLGSVNLQADRSRWTLKDLTGGERALLVALRRWTRHGTAGSMAAVRRSMEAARLPSDTLLPFFTLMGVLAADRTRPVAVQSPDAAAVGLDEARLLDALAAAQAGVEDAAIDILGHWLPVMALCMAASAAQEIGQALSAVGEVLPGGRSGAWFGFAPALAAE